MASNRFETAIVAQSPRPPKRADSGVLAARRVDPGAQLAHVPVAEADEAEADPVLAGRAGLVAPQQVRADLDLDRLAVGRRQRKAELVQGVVDQRLAGHQQHPRFRQVADVPHGLPGHGIGDRDLLVGLAPPCAPEFLHHAGAFAMAGPSPRPAKLRSALIAACHARSTRRPRSAVTRRAWPAAIIRARLSSVCSATRCPRWLTNRALSVIRLYQDR